MTEGRPFDCGAGLRTRTSVAFAALALLLSVSLALMTYGLTRRFLLSKRESLATQQAVVNARAAATRSEIQRSIGPRCSSSLSSTDRSSAVLRSSAIVGSQLRRRRTRCHPCPVAVVERNADRAAASRVAGDPAIIVAVPIGSGRRCLLRGFLADRAASHVADACDHPRDRRRDHDARRCIAGKIREPARASADRNHGTDRGKHRQRKQRRSPSHRRRDLAPFVACVQRDGRHAPGARSPASRDSPPTSATNCAPP